MSKELKPCPFCEHSKPVAYLEEEPIPNGSPKFGFTFHYKAFIMCDNCGSKSTVYLNQYKRNVISDAVKAWNTRPALDGDKELVELLDRVITSVGRAIPAKLRIDIDEAIDKYKEKQ